jgi:hypothetical protein
MPEHCPTLCGSSPNRVPCEADPNAFALLLDMLDSRPTTARHEWSEYEEVIRLGIKFHMKHLEPLIFQYIKTNKPTGNPWGVFELASKHDFPLLATHTVPDLIFSHIWASAADEIRPWDMENVSGRYATALLRAMMQNPPTGNSKNIGHPFIPGKKAYGWRIDWRQVAIGFNLDRW